MGHGGRSSEVPKLHPLKQQEEGEGHHSRKQVAAVSGQGGLKEEVVSLLLQSSVATDMLLNLGTLLVL